LGKIHAILENYATTSDAYHMCVRCILKVLLLGLAS